MQLYFAGRMPALLCMAVAAPTAGHMLRCWKAAWPGWALWRCLGSWCCRARRRAGCGRLLAPVREAAPPPVAWDSLFYSAIYAFLAALAAVAIAAPVLLRQRAQQGWLHRGGARRVLSLANMALPGRGARAAYLISFNSRLLPLYGTPTLLVIAYVAVQVPMLLRFLQAPVEHVHPNLSEAARLHGVPASTRLLDIDGPLLARPFLWGWMMAFGQVFFELPISELLYPAGRAPVGVALVWLNQSLHYTEEARLALAAIALSLLVAGRQRCGLATYASPAHCWSGEPA